MRGPDGRLRNRHEAREFLEPILDHDKLWWVGLYVGWFRHLFDHERTFAVRVNSGVVHAVTAFK